MSEETTTEETTTESAAQPTSNPVDAGSGEAMQSPDFQELSNKNPESNATIELNRFHDVQVTVSAELGRTKVAINELLNLAEGAVFELNRNVSAPVELIAQGVPLGNGEVVVVDDSFAIRIKEIYPNPG